MRKYLHLELVITSSWLHENNRSHILNVILHASVFFCQDWLGDRGFVQSSIILDVLHNIKKAVDEVQDRDFSLFNHTASTSKTDPELALGMGFHSIFATMASPVAFIFFHSASLSLLPAIFPLPQALSLPFSTILHLMLSDFFTWFSHLIPTSTCSSVFILCYLTFTFILTCLPMSRAF